MSVWTCNVGNMNTNETAQLVTSEIEKSGTPVAEVARESGIARVTLIRKMNGGSEFGVYELVRIAAAIGIDPSGLLPQEFHVGEAAA